jgi:hypothetical protein
MEKLAAKARAEGSKTVAVPPVIDEGEDEDEEEEEEEEEEAELRTTKLDKVGPLDGSQAEWADIASDGNTSNNEDDDWSDVGAENIVKESWQMLRETSVSSWSMLTSTTWKPKGASDGNAPEEEKRTDINSSGSFVNLNNPEEASMSFSSNADDYTFQRETRPVPDIVLPETALEENKVSCPRCTLANLPGAQVCSVCEMPLIANPQPEADHQLALSLAQMENDEGTTDLQSLLSSGIVKPHSTAESSIKIIYQRADAILSALKSMKDKLQKQRVCNVVASIEKEQLIQLLIRFQGILRGEAPQLAFGYHLSSMLPEEMMRHHAMEDADEETVRTIPIESYVSAYPSKQLTLCRSKVPDYVWLVFYETSKKRNIGNEKYNRLLFRNREEESFRACRIVSRPLAGIHRPAVIPLLCTANANFRRPYAPRLKPEEARNSCQGAVELAKVYEEAYLEMKYAVTDAMM